MKPIAWIIESKVGPWMTLKPEVAEKYRKTKGAVVTEYFSKIEGVKNEQQTTPH